ncbi:MAG TPA: AAA family ATPase [Candidatus Baltobacteraceae bacterium]
MIVRPVVCRRFIGRQAELAYLQEARLEAGASRGGLIFVAGDAGLGKSRLISEFCRSLAYSRWRTAFGSCREFGGRPYGALLDALSSFDSSATRLAAESKQQYFEGIVGRLGATASRQALLLVIEDLHWADAATLDLLAYLGSKIHRMRILVLASFRPDALYAGHPAAAAIERVGRAAQAGRIDLSPLHGIELQAFINEALAGFSLGDEKRRAIALAGEGNPFFTEELLKNALQEAAEGDDGDGNGNGRVPQSLRTTLLERLRPLEADDRHIVTHAALIGRTFALDLLATVVGTEPERLVPTLRRARDFQLIDELGPNLFRFRHGLTRDAIYGNFLRTELRPLHRRIASALENAPSDARSTEALAYHWWAAGNGELCLRYNELAGDSARKVHAHEDAIAFYERALTPENIDPLARGSILEKIANLRLVLSMAEEGQAAYSAAADVFAAASAFEREAVCRVRAAMTAYTIQLSDTTAPLERMLARLDETEYLARGRLHVGIAWIAAALRCPSRAGAHLEQVDPRATSEATDVAVRYHNVAACVAAALGDADRFRREHAAWLDAARAHGAGAMAGVYYNGAKFFAAFGLHEEARENIDQALRVARETRNRHAEECAYATAALCYVLSGDLRSARQAIDKIPATTDNRVNIIFASGAGAALGAYLGDETLIEKWFDRFEASILSAPEIESGFGFSEVLVRRGRYKDAEELLHRVLPECELVRGEVPTLLAIGRYGAPDDRARAREYLVRAGNAENTIEGPALALFDAMCQSEGQPEQAKRLAREAADGFRRVRTPLLEAAAHEMAGDVGAALALYRRCGATYHVARLEGGASEGADSLDSGTHAEISVLSMREREIVVLAAGGQSNLEIALRLSISHKTVEKHLGAAYQKLGVSSRRALRSYVRR